MATLDPVTALTAALADPAATSTQLQSMAGAPVALRIDIADPPVLMVAMIGAHEAMAATADAAVCALGRVVADAINAAAQAVADATAAVASAAAAAAAAATTEPTPQVLP